MRLFISYAHEYMTPVNELHDRLQAAGHTPWYDKAIRAGAFWRIVLRDEVRRCDVVLFVMTPESLDSKHCRDELKDAKRRGKPIIPLLLTAVENMPPEWRDIQYIDCRHGIDYDTLIPRFTHDADAARTRAEDVGAQARTRLFAFAGLMSLLGLLGIILIPLLSTLTNFPPLTATMVARVSAFSGNCTNTASDLEQEIQLEDSSIVLEPIQQSFENSSTARIFADEQNLEVLIWGRCPINANNLELHVEIMSSTSPAVFDLLSLSAEVVNLQRAADFSAAALYYADGGTENYQRAAQRLEAMQAIPLEWAFLRANSLLFAGYEFYSEALEIYETVQDDEPLRARVLNNMGVTAFNTTVGYLMRDEYDEFEATIEAAHTYFSDAIEAAAGDTEILNVVHVNLGTLHYVFYEGETAEAELASYEAAYSECSAVATAQAYICRAAARYWQFYQRPASGDFCEPSPDIAALESDLQSAENITALEPEIYFWYFNISAFSHQCTPNTTTAERANSYLAQYRTLMANRRGLLEIDRYYLEWQPISED